MSNAYLFPLAFVCLVSVSLHFPSFHAYHPLESSLILTDIKDFDKQTVTLPDNPNTFYTIGFP